MVNDGSTDGSSEILERFAERKEIKYVYFVDNRGEPYAINFALSFVKTPYVLIVDMTQYLSAVFAHNSMRGFYSKDVVGVCGRVLPNRTYHSVQKSRLVEYLYGQRMYKLLQTRCKGLRVLAGCR